MKSELQSRWKIWAPKLAPFWGQETISDFSFYSKMKHWPASLSGRGHTQMWTMKTDHNNVLPDQFSECFVRARKPHNINITQARPGADNMVSTKADFWFDRNMQNWTLIGPYCETEIKFKCICHFFPIENYCSKKLVVSLLQVWLIVSRLINTVTA